MQSCFTTLYTVYLFIVTNIDKILWISFFLHSIIDKNRYYHIKIVKIINVNFCFNNYKYYSLAENNYTEKFVHWSHLKTFNQ